MNISIEKTFPLSDFCIFSRDDEIIYENITSPLTNNGTFSKIECSEQSFKKIASFFTKENSLALAKAYCEELKILDYSNEQDCYLESISTSDNCIKSITINYYFDIEKFSSFLKEEKDSFQKEIYKNELDIFQKEVFKKNIFYNKPYIQYKNPRVSVKKDGIKVFSITLETKLKMTSIPEEHLEYMRVNKLFRKAIYTANGDVEIELNKIIHKELNDE